MFTEAAAPPESVVTVKVAERAPAATVTLAGTVALATLEEVSVTKAPPAAATPFNVTVPVEVAPRITLVGLRMTEKACSAEATVSVACAVTAPKVPLMTEVVFAATVKVVIVKVAVVAPAATVTLAGTVAAVVTVLVSVTTAPPVGAGPFNVTVPVELDVPNTVEGARVTV
jgi:hypothetical protein